MAPRAYYASTAAGPASAVNSLFGSTDLRVLGHGIWFYMLDAYQPQPQQPLLLCVVGVATMTRQHVTFLLLHKLLHKQGDPASPELFGLIEVH